MLKQIHIKSINGDDLLIKKMYDEAQKYLENIGFAKTPLVSLTDADVTFRSFLFKSGKENVMIEFKKDMYEDILKLAFSPMDIEFVYDILLMRFKQISAEDKESVYIYNE